MFPTRQDDQVSPRMPPDTLTMIVHSGRIVTRCLRYGARSQNGDIAGGLNLCRFPPARRPEGAVSVVTRAPTPRWKLSRSLRGNHRPRPSFLDGLFSPLSNAPRQIAQVLANANFRFRQRLIIQIPSDVDLVHGLLTVRKTKFGKTRLVPVHPTTSQALRVYARQRDTAVPSALSDGFFLNESGTRLTGWALQYTWVKLTRKIGLRGPNDRRGPRIHDRHRFAAESLLRWYRQ